MNSRLMVETIRVTPTSYIYNGNVYDRITKIIQVTWPQLELQDWRAEIGKARANRQLRHAAHVGTLVDAAITSSLKGTLLRPSVSVEVRQALRGFREWRKLNPFTPLVCQRPLLDIERRIGGTPDCLSPIEGFEWKTSAQFSFPHLLQVDQYWRMAESQGYSLTRYRLVRFDKILGIWEERILMPEGIELDGIWLTRDFLKETFATLLSLYRQWHYVTGQGQTLVVSSTKTSTETA